MYMQASMCIARPSSLLGKSLKTKQTAGNTRTRSAFNVHAKMTKKGGKGAAYRSELLILVHCGQGSQNNLDNAVFQPDAGFWETEKGFLFDFFD